MDDFLPRSRQRSRDGTASPPKRPGAAYGRRPRLHHRRLRSAARHAGASRTSRPASRRRCRTTKEGADDRARRPLAGRGRRSGRAPARRPRWICCDACWRQPRRGQPAGERDDLARPRRRRAGRRAADAAVATRRRLGPLHGVPMAHKDMYYQAGMLCTCGSALRRDFVPDRHRHGDRAHVGGRRLHLRRAEHGGVRAEPDRPQPHLRRLPQSVEPALHHRRLVVGLGRRRSPRASTTWRSARTPAARSGCPPRPAASPASSRRRPACRATA